MRPPTRSCASYTRTGTPCWRSRQAAVSPAMPAPTMATSSPPAERIGAGSDWQPASSTLAPAPCSSRRRRRSMRCARTRSWNSSSGMPAWREARAIAAARCSRRNSGVRPMAVLPGSIVPDRYYPERERIRTRASTAASADGTSELAQRDGRHSLRGSICRCANTRPSRPVSPSSQASVRARALAQVFQDLAGRVASRQAGDAAARVAAGAAQVQAAERTAVIALPQQRARAEHLVEAERAVEDVAAEQADAALQVERAQRLVAEHAAGEVRRVLVHGVDHQLRHRVAMRVPAAVLVADDRIHLLAEQAGDVLARWRQGVVQGRG